MNYFPLRSVPVLIFYLSLIMEQLFHCFRTKVSVLWLVLSHFFCSPGVLQSYLYLLSTSSSRNCLISLFILYFTIKLCKNYLLFPMSLNFLFRQVLWRFLFHQNCLAEVSSDFHIANSDKWKWSEVAQSWPTLCDPMDCSLPGSSVHGIFQARILEWVGCHFLLQGIFPTPGSNPGLPHCKQML